MGESAIRRSIERASASLDSVPSLEQGLFAGSVEVRLARTPEEIRQAQLLRYDVFYNEMSARPSAAVAAAKLDFDRFDDYCDHLLAIDHAVNDGEVIGTYRLLRRSMAERHEGFYTATEFDIGPLLAAPGEILELGRACVAPAYRSRPTTMQLLWRGITTYCVHHDVKIMFGCGSLPGTDPQALARPLSYLHHNHLAPPHVRAKALPDRYVRTDLLPALEVDYESAVAALDARALVAALPPLIKGYLRVGGYIGDGAVIDYDFGTTDVCIIVLTDLMARKYFKHMLKGD
jgi:putative hemolysin